MKRLIGRAFPVLAVCALFVSLTGCGVVQSGADEYNELVSLVQGVQSAAANFQLVTDTQYAKIQAKTQITKDYYDAVAQSGEVWTGNFRDEAAAMTELLKNYRDANGQPLDPTKLNLQRPAEQGRAAGRPGAGLHSVCQCRGAGAAARAGCAGDACAGGHRG